MAMSRKNYVNAAERIRLSGYDDATRRILAKEFSDFFRADNSRFDEGRFWEAATKAPRGKLNPPSRGSKFDSALDEVLYSMDPDQQMTSLDGKECFGLFSGILHEEIVQAAFEDGGILEPEDYEEIKWPLNAIISRDSQGFVHVEYFGGPHAKRDLREAWREIQEEYEDQEED